ncbi:hypothetical protein A3A84_04045 [Candidatus Collierbacteria bacterium RIFCSPLOWO2_01_FULL_50_23]|nr:MAG: hypothetical protein A3A84_04045 [Candidatus Collierbacteria bacterium RIFCSPLOWO2_01_FULL_50_23]
MSKDNKEKKRNLFPLVAAIVAAALYFAMAISWLVSKDIGLITAALIAITVFIVMTVGVCTAMLLKMAEKKEAPTGREGSRDRDNQQELSRELQIEGLRREAVKVHDRIFRVGAIISVALILYAAIMKTVFGLTPEELFFVAWPLVALIWFVQIVFFPRWLTYTSFLVLCGLRVGIQIFGLGILAMLPNFIMMPFFYLLMMFFMFGSIMLPSLSQVKYNRPGQGSWGVLRGATRGQPRARAVFDTAFEQIEAYVSGKSDIRPPRGVLAHGPPGTGKTLLAKEKATESRFPFVHADGQVFNPPFMGFAPIMKMVVQAMVEGLAREYGYCILFLDEIETLLAARDSGMAQSQQRFGLQDFNIPGNDLAFEGKSQGPTEHQMFLPGAMGGNAGIYGFLTWMDGMQSPPFFTKLALGIANTLLSVFLPVTAFGRILRFGPAKVGTSNVLFIGATNRPGMLDSAVRRPGRFDFEAVFEEPDDMARFDLSQYYIKLLHKQRHIRDELLDEKIIWAFALATRGMAHAKIEQVIRQAVPVRTQHLSDLRRVGKLAETGGLETEAIASLSENERRQREMDVRFWKRHSREVCDNQGKEIPGGWDERVNWDALIQSLSKASWGAVRYEAIHPETKMKVAYHEVGHFLMLVILLVKRFKSIPTVLTALPRGDDSLGKIVYMPNDHREMQPQEYYEGALRVGLGAWTAERYLFNQNMPGVSGDLRQTTGQAAFMLSRLGMPPMACTDEERERCQAIGLQVISEPEAGSFLNPGAGALVEKTLSGHRKEIALMLGMAVRDIYRLLRANREIYARVVAELIREDEISGPRLEELQNEILAQLVDFDQMSPEDRTAFPQDDFKVANPFYGETVAEGADVIKRVEELLRVEGAQGGVS